MKLVKGNLFEARCDILLVTTNSYIRKDGSLVMGKGAALQANRICPGLDKELGALIRAQESYQEGMSNWYGIILTRPRNRNIGGTLSVGAFQVKYHFKEDANLGLIRFSTNDLKELARMMPEHQFALNFPGIGNGRLQREEVLPIISELPDNVTVYEL